MIAKRSGALFSVSFLEHGVSDFLLEMIGFIFFDDLVAMEEVIEADRKGDGQLVILVGG